MDEEKSSNFNENKTNENEKVFLQTDYNNDKNTKLLSFNSIRSFSVRKENPHFKEKEEIYYLYDKQIFDPIYSQIHKNIKDFELEIKNGKKYLKTNKNLQKEIFHYNFKTGNLLLDNSKETTLKKKLLKNKNIKKSLFSKTFSGNINNLKTGNKKKVMFNNIHLNDIINNKTSDDKRLSIKSYTERNRIEDDKNYINNEFKLNIPFLKKNSNVISRNFEKKFISTNSLINFSQFNRTLTASTIQDNNNNYRIKTYFVEYDPKWYFKNKLIKTRFEKDTISSPLFQKKLIDDELILLFDNMKEFQSKYLVNKNIFRDFGKLSHASQVATNTNLEESIGLFKEISYLLIDNYSMDIQKYISNPIPRSTEKDIKKVISEKKEFKINTNTFYDCYIFVKVCYETYKIILNTKKNFSINKTSFEKLFQFLDRARYTVSKVCAELNSLYQEPNKDDKALIDRCMNRIKKNHLKILNNFKIENKKDETSIIYNSKSFNRTKFLKKFNSKYKSKIDCHQKFGLFNSGIDSFSYKGPKKLKLSAPQLMNVRINRAFNDNSRNLKLRHFPKFDINSPLVNSLMKYATYKFKSDIISERIRQRFSNANNDE